MSPSLQTMGFFMSDINFCNTKEQLNHLGEVVTGKVNGSPTGADIDTSTLNYTGQVRKTLPALEGEYEQSITDKEVEADAAIDSYRLLNKGPYASGITLESKFEYITYNGESYFATNPPYTTTAITPDADGNLFVGNYITSDFGTIISGTEVKHRRGTNSEILAGTPAIGELWFNTTDNSINMGDGITQGGIKHINTQNIMTFEASSISDMTSGVSQFGVVTQASGQVWKVTSNNEQVTYRITTTSDLGGIQLNGGLYAVKVDSSNSKFFLYSGFIGENATDQQLYLYSGNTAGQVDRLGSDSFYKSPTGVLRDPSIGKVGDMFFMFYTIVLGTGSYLTTTYGLAKSSNLVDWDHVSDFDLSTQFPSASRCWAPEFFEDYNGDVYAVIAIDDTVHLIKHTGENLEVAEPAVDIGLTTGDYIDANIHKHNGTYTMFVKNETTKYIERWDSNSLLSGWAVSQSGDWAGWGQNVEGPNLVVNDDGSVVMYFDSYSEGKYYYSQADDILSASWTAREEISSSGEVRHFASIKLTGGDVALLNNRNFTKVSSLEVGSTKAAEVISVATNSPRNNAMQNYKCANPYALFQARDENNRNGTDFVVRPGDGYTAIECLPSVGSPKEAVKWYHETGKPEFPNGTVPRDGFDLEPLLVNSWVTDTYSPEYHISDDGVVSLRGTVKGGSTSPSTVIATLPTGFRPPNSVVFPVVNNDSTLGVVGVDRDGNIVFLSGTNVKLDLANVRFRID